jgi:perosamine synthetase
VPVFRGREIQYLREAVKSTWVSSQGPFLARFEAAVREVMGGGHVVAVMNGTSALHTALMVAGVGLGDEVLVPSLTFVATANAVTYCGAHPVFMDSDETSGGLDPLKVEEFLRRECDRRKGTTIDRATGRPVRALLPVHVLGHPVDMDALRVLARRVSFNRSLKMRASPWGPSTKVGRRVDWAIFLVSASMAIKSLRPAGEVWS